MGVALFLFLQLYEKFSSDWSDTIRQFYGNENDNNDKSFDDILHLF